MLSGTIFYANIKQVLFGPVLKLMHLVLLENVQTIYQFLITLCLNINIQRKSHRCMVTPLTHDSDSKGFPLGLKKSGEVRVHESNNTVEEHKVEQK